MLLEEHYHEAADVSYADVTANDFDVVLDDAVIKSFLDQTELVAPFDVKDFSVVECAYNVQIHAYTYAYMYRYTHIQCTYTCMYMQVSYD